MSVALVTGFGPFEGVRHNPSATLAEAVDGLRLAGFTVVGQVIPVSYARGPELTVQMARHLGASLVLGLGVAVSRPQPWVERLASPPTSEQRPDVDGATPGPTLVQRAPQESSLDWRLLSQALDCGVSTDAGRYVCNAWLFEVSRQLKSAQVGFLHIPSVGMSPARLRVGLVRLLEER